MANTREPILQPIPILSLRPTQMTVGMREVKEKRKRWREHKSKKKQSELLGRHMIPVVLGPDQHYYVVDHHHLARAQGRRAQMRVKLGAQNALQFRQGRSACLLQGGQAAVIERGLQGDQRAAGELVIAAARRRDTDIGEQRIARAGIDR